MGELSESRSYVASYDWAVLHAGLEQNDAALQRLQQAVDERQPRVIWLKLDPAFEGLRGEKRFQDLIRRLELD